MHLDITKIVVHEGADDIESVFIFTPHKLNSIDYLSFRLDFPPGEGKKWVEKEIGTTTYEVVKAGFEVKAPA